MIILAATPIGNLGDASARLREALERAPVVASEDTRVTQRLLAGLGIANRPRLIALHEHNERQKSAALVELARDGDLLVLSDAGMPTVSDPGFPLVQAAAAAGVMVTVIPGPSAVVTALAVSGLPTDRFAFEGFLPRKSGERARRLAELAQWAAGGVRGEICIVVGGAAEVQADVTTALDRVLELAASGTRLKDAAALVAAESGLGKRDLYEAALAARRAD